MTQSYISRIIKIISITLLLRSMKSLKTKIVILGTSPLFSQALKDYIFPKENNLTIDLESTVDSLFTKERINAELLMIDITQATSTKLAKCNRLKRRMPKLKILALDSTLRVAVARKCFFLNLDGYIGMYASVEEFKLAIDQVMAGEKYIQTSLSKIWANKLTRKSNRGNSKITKRESEVLRLIVDEYTTKEIAEKLYVGKCTVETHRLNLLQKFNVKNTAGLVREAMFMFGLGHNFSNVHT